MNPVVIILLLAIGGAYTVNALNASNTGKKSSIKLLNVDSLKVIGTEFEISATIAIDNPTANPITVKKPYLKVFYNGNEIGNSIPSGEFIPIKANARTTISKVNLRVPMTSVPALVMAVFNSKISEQAISVEVSTVVSGIPIKDTKEFKIADLMKSLKK